MVQKPNEHGSVLVEALVAAALVLAAIVGLAGAFSYGLQSTIRNTSDTEALLLAEEGLEAVRTMRDVSWTSQIAPHTSGSPFYLEFNSSHWVATSTNIFINGEFERAVTLLNVNRDGNQNIVVSGGTYDPNTKRVVVSVSWHSGVGTTTRTLTTYLTNMFDN